MPIRLSRPPRTRNELHALIKGLWGVNLPRVKVCPDHVSPFEAVAHAYFAEEPGYAVWYASRGSGKSLALAVLGLTKTFVLDADTTILGGSMTQSQNVREHMGNLLLFPNAPIYALKKETATQITTVTGRRIRPLPASQTTVRGPHPPLSLLDEVDEMEYAIYEAAMGQAMEQVNAHGHTVQEYIVASSTWQNPDGTFTKVMDDARDKGLPIFTWCWRELLKSPDNPDGWMSERFIASKRRAVSAQMWKTEYDLNEPSGADRAFDLDKVEEFFVDYPEPLQHNAHGNDDEVWVWENWEPSGEYHVGADWAKSIDKTIIAVIRTDIYPRRLVYLRRVNKRPYPVMIAMFDDAVAKYRAKGKHDKTGLGSVVHDVSEAASADYSQVDGFDFRAAQKRTQMLLGYITDFENGAYRLPRSIPSQERDTNKGLIPYYRAHRNTTNADVYAPSKWDAHLPDDVAAMALAHLSAGRTTEIDVDNVGVPTDDTPRQADARFHVPAVDSSFQLMGGVTVVDEINDGTFWLDPSVM